MMPFHVIERVKNMTRETKLGLVVSCSFLGLLGAVLVMKMTGRPEDEQGPEVAAAAQKEGAPPSEKAGKPAPAAAGKAAPTKPAPPSKRVEPDKLPPNLDNQVVQTRGTSPPSASHPTGDGEPPPMSPPPAADPDLPPIPSAAPPATPAAPPAVASTPPPTSGGGFLSSVWGKVKGTTVAAVRNGRKTNGDKNDGNKPVAKADNGLPPIAATPAGPMPPDEGALPPIAAAPAGGGDPMAVKPMPTTKPGGGDPALPGLPAAPVPAEPKKTDPPVPPPPVAPATGDTEPPLRPIPAAPLPPVKPSSPTPTIDVPPVAPKPAAQAGGIPPVKGPDPIEVGRSPAAAVPAMPVPAVPAVRAAQPEVVSYTEETYTANAGDSFKSISQAKYGTDAYARALYLFNRSHPLAGDELLQSDALKPRQPVYIPPAAILRSRYPEAVGDAKAAGVSVGTTSQRANTATPSRTYRVGAGGEKVYDIASRQLGDGNRWVEIRDLNPGWNPELPIPAGTTLMLPQ
jgi:hypothetical protein